MEPTLLGGDRIFVSKYTYGYSKHSFPFSPPILNKRIFYSEPKYGDLIVFKTPSDNRTDFIKRLMKYFDNEGADMTVYIYGLKFCRILNYT